MVLAVFFAATAAPITVWRQGRDAWIQSRFSDTQDIVINIWLDANERAFLIPRGGDIKQAGKGKLLHINSDEYPATTISNYGYLSGNHGSAAARQITAPAHGFTDADIGKIITDERNRNYVLVLVKDADAFIIHPESTKPTDAVGQAVFPRHVKEKLFFNGKEIKFESSVLVQLRPLNRISRNEFLVDGKTPLPDDTVVKCSFLDHVFEHDVVAPEAYVSLIKDKAGRNLIPRPTIGTKMFYPEDEPGADDFMKLPAIMIVKNRLRYQDNGAMVNYRQCSYPVYLESVGQLEVMFGWTGLFSSGAYQRFYIPKTSPMTFKGYKDNSREYELDFVKGVDISKGLDLNASISSQNVPDPSNPPDRFIRVTGDASPEYGIALGYSLILGHTAITSSGRDASQYYFLWHTQKMYPRAYTLRKIKPGTTVETVSYKQYFCPMDDPDLTAFYYHHQGDSLMVYVEAHKPLNDKRLNLPLETLGNTIAIVEKTPSVTLLQPTDIVTPDGIHINSVGDYGHIVLKLRTPEVE